MYVYLLFIYMYKMYIKAFIRMFSLRYMYLQTRGEPSPKESQSCWTPLTSVGPC